MKNGYLEQFLDTGWYTDATLYFNGYIYWCGVQRLDESSNVNFFVDKWEVESENDLYYHSKL
ncbi:MAG: hypothetical protein Q4D21_06230 [Phascolarctobacterium sp.]|nr:hypothetical protein [Phascolarctobacterium sp.]